MSISGQLDTTRVAADGTGRQVSSTTKTEAIWVVTSSSFVHGRESTPVQLPGQCYPHMKY